MQNSKSKFTWIITINVNFKAVLKNEELIFFCMDHHYHRLLVPSNFTGVLIEKFLISSCFLVAHRY